MRLIRLVAMRYRLRLARYSLRASMWLAMVGKRITAFEAVSTIPTRRFCRRVFHSHNSVDLGAIEACPASLAALQSYRRQEALHRCRKVKGVQALPLGRAQ